jgi:hypothetical protein
MVGFTTTTRRHSAAQQGQSPKEDIIIISGILWPCSFEGLYEHCADMIVSYAMKKFKAEGNGNEGLVYETIVESHPLFGPASEILLDRENGTRAVEWECETPDLRIGIIQEPQEWCNPVRGAKNSSASRRFASDHGAKLWLAVEKIPPHCQGE